MARSTDTINEQAIYNKPCRTTALCRTSYITKQTNP